MKTLNILKGKLDTETKEKLGVSQQLSEMSQHAETLRQSVSTKHKFIYAFLRLWCSLQLLFQTIKFIVILVRS